MLIPLIVASALFMDILDSTVISTSLPQIAASFGEDPVRLSLAITGYLLSLAVFLPLSGHIADRYGARTVFAAAIVIFTGSSVLCGLSQNLTQLFLARILQGIGGSMMTPVGRLLILRSVEKRQLVSAMAYFTIPALIAPVAGPPLGGFITTYFHWRWIFFINVPIGVLGLALVLAFIPNSRASAPPRLDLKSWVLAAAGLAGLLFGLENFGSGVLPFPVSLAVLALAMTAVLLYVRHARTAPHPVLDLSLLKIDTVYAAIIGGFFFRLGLGSQQLLLPLMLQLVFGLTAFMSGLITLFFAAGALLTKFIAEPLFRRFGFRRIMIWNAFISAFFYAVFVFFSPETPQALIVLAVFLGGAFRSVQFTALNTLAYADLDARQMNAGSTLGAVGQQFSIATGVAAGALLLHGLAGLRGGSLPAMDDFRYAFAALALITLVSVIFFAALSDKAGSAISGYGLDENAAALAAPGADAMFSEGNGTQPSGPKASSG